MNAESKSVRWAMRIYAASLRLYPRGHRREYGPLMLQLFRDQCRDAGRPGQRRSLPALWSRTLADLACSAFREQLTQQINHMKNMPPKTLSRILFAAAIGTGLVSCSLLPGQPGLALGLAYGSALILLLRAVVEWKRPANELIESLTGGAIIAVIFALIMPVWAKFKLPVAPVLILLPMALNALVPLIKTGLHLARPRP